MSFNVNIATNNTVAQRETVGTMIKFVGENKIKVVYKLVYSADRVFKVCLLSSLSEEGLGLTRLYIYFTALSVCCH